MFGQTANTLSVKDQLLCLRQGKSSVMDYALKFRTLTATSGWNETPLLMAYWHGLYLQIHQQMAIYDDIIGLEAFIQCSIWISPILAEKATSSPCRITQEN